MALLSRPNFRASLTVMAFCASLLAPAASAQTPAKAQSELDDNLLAIPRPKKTADSRGRYPRTIANATGFTADTPGSNPAVKKPGDTGLSSLSEKENRERAEQIAEITGTAKILAEVKDLQSQLNGGAAASTSTNDSNNASNNEQLIQRLIYHRGKLVQYLQTSSFEVNAVKAEVELAIAKIDDARARIVEKRARVLKRNSIINFVSGGVTKMVGYSIALSNVDLPTNLLEIVDGGIQSSLSGLAVKEQEDEKHFVQSVPTLLTTIIDGTNDQTHDYPAGVWRYLNSRAFAGEAIVTASTLSKGGDTTGGETRRDKLIAAWSSSGMLGNKKTARNDAATPPGKISQGKTFSAQLLEDRAAMLSDLKSVVAQMNNNLMQLSELVKASYQQDPPI
jgi:hypothetical protein